ncbi:MAG: RNA pyrophosphohydrolase [Alphaproteobacteria bacterium CG_4_9_14_3_um_filter_47_13]|nr:MAG: RNA pyrophosphohydrolase [Alphaproteobacteria bacterium CG_4_9_14_3_um_filter_47_13]
MSKDYSNLPYRACVGIVLFNEDRRVFLGERLESKGAWQLPQGGIDEGETLEQAFFREMKEETGTDQATILKVHDEIMRYTLPHHLLGRLWNGKYAGQDQTWVAARYTGTDDDFNIYYHHFPEFQSWQWTPLNDIVDLVVPFKRETYSKIIEAFKDL